MLFWKSLRFMLVMSSILNEYQQYQIYSSKWEERKKQNACTTQSAFIFFFVAKPSKLSRITISNLNNWKIRDEGIARPRMLRNLELNEQLPKTLQSLIIPLNVNRERWEQEINIATWHFLQQTHRSSVELTLSNFFSVSFFFSLAST